jgi:uncharacterized membrane protein YhaH (DUF805 family)
MDYKTLLFSFEGRINRKPYWMFILAIIAVNIALVGVSIVVGEKLGTILLLVFALLIIWSALAMQVKRWHDRDKSAWWLLMNLVPVIGPLWVLVECGFLAGTSGQNQFGSDPLAGKS